jgi:hypothetical protein
MARRAYGKKFGMLDRRDEAVEPWGSTDPAERLFALPNALPLCPSGPAADFASSFAAATRRVTGRPCPMRRWCGDSATPRSAVIEQRRK